MYKPGFLDHEVDQLVLKYKYHIAAHVYHARPLVMLHVEYGS